jgi:hypothetical protein
MAELLVCWQEADRADDIAAALHRIQSDVDILLVSEIADIKRQIQFSSRLLRDLFDLFPIYTVRAQYLFDYLAIIIPCLRRTLQDIWHRLGDYPDFSFNRIWVDLDEHFRTQGDVSLKERITLYNDFLVQLVRLLSRSAASFPVIGGSLTVSRPWMYDASTLELLRIRVLRLRIGRGLPGTHS